MCLKFLRNVLLGTFNLLITADDTSTWTYRIESLVSLVRGASYLLGGLKLVF